MAADEGMALGERMTAVRAFLLDCAEGLLFLYAVLLCIVLGGILAVLRVLTWPFWEDE